MSFADSRLNRRSFIAATGAVTALAVAGPRVLAQDASPVAEEGPGLPPLPEGATVVAEGLWNPTDLTVGPDGTVYVSESGVSGGTGPDAGMATPGADGNPIPAGPMLVAGQVSAIPAGGAPSVLAGNLGSVVGIGLKDTTLYVASGGGSVGSGFAPLPVENVVSAIDIATGTITTIVELGPYEVANNPDGTDVNPNLYGMAIAADGTIYQADAGGNTIYKVAPAAKSFELFTIVPSLEQLTGATPTAEEQAQQPGPRQPVPTTVLIDPAGNVVVLLLSEFWPGPSILTFASDGSYTASGSGLSMIVNGAYGPDGNLYLSQLTPDISSEQPQPGNVLRVGADGSAETVVGGLFFPHGIAFDADGHLYVTTNSIISGPDAPLGMVLRFDGIASAA